MTSKHPHNFSSKMRGVTPTPSVVILTIISVLLVLLAFHMAANKIESSNPEASLDVSAQLTPFGSKAILTVHVYNSGSTQLRLDSIILRKGTSSIPLSPNPRDLNKVLKPGESFEGSYLATPSSVNPGDEFLVIVEAYTPNNQIIEGSTEVVLL